MATLDTLQDAVNSLTTSTTTLVNEVQVKKATLDASVADAETAQTAAAASAATASGHATSAAASAAAAAATASGIAGFDLDAISQVKAVTAVDVFVYDTSKDSDGGAWRKRTQHTSWYNETLNTATRGSRREFPAVAVIVAEASKVTIYDGDDPALPMWMVFNRDSSTPDTTNAWWRASSTLVASSVEALNGKLCITLNGITSSSCGLLFLNFPSDNAGRYSDTGTSGGEGLAITDTFNNSLPTDLPAIVQAVCNDVAMTVLPDAPIDPATGLPVPTIAVATAGGVSVIKDDGTVVDSAHAGSSIEMMFVGSVLYGAQESTVSTWRNYGDVSLIAADGFTYKTLGTETTPALLGRTESLSPVASGSDTTGGSAGVTFIQEDGVTYANSMVAYTTSAYNTGWMNGDIKGAFLSSTDATSLVGSGELVTNGTFDTDTSGWTAELSAIISSVSGVLRVENGAATEGRAVQAISTVVGKSYTVQGNITSSPSGNWGAIRVSNSSSGASAFAGSTTGVGFKQFTFVATATTTYVGAFTGTGSLGATIEFDNISVKLADADRSVNNKGLIVNGTVTRSAVATGAGLVAYSGFSSSNYLEQPYNSALDFGTGDFCVMGWVKGADTYCGLVDRGTGTAGFGSSFAVGGNATSKLYGKVGASSGYSTADVWSGTWRFVCLVRSSGVAYFYVDGLASGSFTAADNVTNTSAITRLGLRTDGAAAFDGSSYMALWRISATAPTAEQIKKIYEDEKVLFQENAQATLYGTSDAVTALAHDSDTGLLHVGTSAGRSVFQGLRRVSNTTTAVGTAISASNGLVVEE